jgi:Gpi18-like mannosyltransferase
LFTSSILLIGIFQPRPDFPYSDFTQNQIVQLEQRSEFSKLFLAPWYRWDTGHYIEIADHGYDFDPILSVWPPFYPFLIKTLSLLVEPSILSAIIISNLFFIFGLFLLYLLIQEILNEDIAKRTLYYVVIFPTSFYFVAGFTESIFLFFSVLVFFLLRRKKWIWAGFISALAALTRVQGLLLIIPIIIELWFEYSSQKDWKSLILHLSSCVYAPFAYGLYSLYVFFGLKVNWPWVTLSSEWNQHFGWPWEGFFSLINIMFGREIENDITPTLVKLLSIILPLMAIYLLFKLRKLIPFSISAYSWAMLILIMGKIDDNHAFVSTIRYLITIFPLFIGQAIFIKNKYIKLGYFSLSIMSQIVLVVYFYWWIWVA